MGARFPAHFRTLYKVIKFMNDSSEQLRRGNNFGHLQNFILHHPLLLAEIINRLQSTRRTGTIILGI